ncbi:15378_t:CDS:2 [Cetraspora pellucida]|uniref:15378_t:CDS:1 n=1 Tax=Cetraspora pellucida TaxID=1433469 RepID=A0A9N9JYV6_9GLOM|nr:15378_t:CDS:2 [Cetraspora pellucida]
MKKLNRHILLILDGAPSHVTSAFTLTNVKVLTLPPYTTSKIQPMDAGIIASFKLYYRHIQLQQAIDRDEAGEKDIYKIDQLQAMKWIKIAWSEVSAETIRRCWFCTKIVSPRDENGIPVIPSIAVESINNVEESLPLDSNDQQAAKELQQQIDLLNLHNPMPIEDLLNLDEELEVHHLFTDEDLIQTATEIEQVEDEFVVLPLTGEEQLIILRSALRIVDERIDDGGVTMKTLRKLQTCIREEIRKEKVRKQVQQKLEQYFQA